MTIEVYSWQKQSELGHLRKECAHADHEADKLRSLGQHPGSTVWQRKPPRTLGRQCLLQLGRSKHMYGALRWPLAASWLSRHPDCRRCGRSGLLS